MTAKMSDPVLQNIPLLRSGGAREFWARLPQRGGMFVARRSQCSLPQRGRMFSSLRGNISLRWSAGERQSGSTNMSLLRSGRVRRFGDSVPTTNIRSFGAGACGELKTVARLFLSGIASRRRTL